MLLAAALYLIKKLEKRLQVIQVEGNGCKEHPNEYDELHNLCLIDRSKVILLELGLHCSLCW